MTGVTLYKGHTWYRYEIVKTDYNHFRTEISEGCIISRFYNNYIKDMLMRVLNLKISHIDPADRQQQM